MNRHNELTMVEKEWRLLTRESQTRSQKYANITLE
jgi:hypothetical protein